MDNEPKIIRTTLGNKVQISNDEHPIKYKVVEKKQVNVVNAVDSFFEYISSNIVGIYYKLKK